MGYEANGFRSSYDPILLDPSGKRVSLGTIGRDLDGIAGSSAWAYDYDTKVSVRPLASGTWHTCLVKAEADVLGYSADSAVVVTDDGIGGLLLQRLQIDPETFACSTSTVDTWTGATSPSFAAVNDSGFALAAEESDAVRRIRYYTWEGTHTVLSRAGYKAPESYSTFDINSEVAVWRSDDHVIRSPLSGTAGQSITSAGGDPVLTTGGTAWVTAAGALAIVASGQSTITSSGGYTVTSETLASSGSHLFLSKGTSPTAAGIYEVASTTDLPAKFYVPGAPTETVGAIAMQAGHLAYLSDKGTAGHWSVYKRPVSRSGDTITVGSASLVASSATSYSLATSGKRITYSTGTSSATSRLTDNGAAPTSLGAGNTVIAMSGNWLLYANSSSRFYVKDLAAPETAAKALPTSVDEGALFGNYLVTLDQDTGNMTRQNLATGTTIRVPLPTGSASVGNVSTWGKHVVFFDYDAHKIRDYDTSSKTTTSLTIALETYVGALRAGAGYIAFVGVDASSGTPTSQLRTWKYGSTTSSLVTSDLDYHFSIAVDDDRVAFVSKSGQLRVAPLPSFTSAPRYLGNAADEASFTPSASTDKTWSLQVPLTKPLSTCTVTIRNSAKTVVRTLSCGSAYGDVRLTWDGKKASGAVVPDGTYTWTLTGKDADGALLYYDGSTKAISGSLKVS